MDLRELVCRDGGWLELAQDHVQWWALELKMIDPLGSVISMLLIVFTS
jgi:hypothetical protein